MEAASLCAVRAKAGGLRCDGKAWDLKARGRRPRGRATIAEMLSAPSAGSSLSRRPPAARPKGASGGLGGSHHPRAGASPRRACDFSRWTMEVRWDAALVQTVAKMANKPKHLRHRPPRKQLMSRPHRLLPLEVQASKPTRLRRKLRLTTPWTARSKPSVTPMIQALRSGQESPPQGSRSQS